MGKITDCDMVYGPGNGHLHETGIGGNPYPYGECTWFCWQYYHDLQNVSIRSNLGNATEWVNSAHREKWTVDNTPGVHKTVCWSAARYPTFGHVAVCTAVDGVGGGFWVVEMNFTYFADGDARLAGKVDCRHVTDMSGILGFITPQGVTIGGDGQTATLLAGADAFSSVASSISQAGLMIQADLMTAGHKFNSLAQMGLGVGVMGGGTVLGALTLAGKGDPRQGVQAVRGRFGERPPPAVGQSDSVTGAQLAWLPKSHRGRQG